MRKMRRCAIALNFPEEQSFLSGQTWPVFIPIFCPHSFRFSSILSPSLRHIFIPLMISFLPILFYNTNNRNINSICQIHWKIDLKI